MASADTINNVVNYQSNTTVGGASGRDFVFNYASNVTINAGAGNDSISSFGERVSINGGAGNDFIHSTGGEDVTLNGGAGNDTIVANWYTSDLIQFASNGGNDVIRDFSSSDTIQLLDGSVRAFAFDGNGNDLVITVKGAKSTGTIRLEDYGDYEVRIVDASGKVSAVNYYNSIYNWSNDTLISGSKDQDRITNYGSNVTIVGGKGDDKIYNDGVGNVYRFGASVGNDLISGFRDDDTLEITSGTISAYPVGADLVVSVKGAKSSGNGRVTLTGNAFNVINVIDKGKHTTLSAYNRIENYYDYYTVVSGTKNRDYIYNNAGYVTINAGAGDDVIDNWGDSSSINAGAGDDSIRANWQYVTIRGGTGNDTIGASGGGYRTFQYNGGDGSDVIIGWNYTDTLRLSKATVASGRQSDDDYIISIKGAKSNGTITLKDNGITPIRVRNTKGKLSVINYSKINTVGKTVVSGTSGDDWIFNEGDEVSINGGTGSDVIFVETQASTINAGAGDDTIIGYGSYNSINGGAGADLIDGDFHYSTIDAGAGDDTIIGYGDYSSINGGAGNDSIDAYNSTVRGGADNDTLYGNNNVYQFGTNDGHDLVQNFSVDDTISIIEGSLTGSSVKGSDVVLKVGSNTVVTIESAATTPIKVRDTKGNMSVVNYPIYNFKNSTVVSGTKKANRIFNGGVGVTINAVAGNDTIENEGSYASINGGAGNDYVYNIAAGDYSTIDGGAGDDIIYCYNLNWGSVNGGSGNDYIYGYYYDSTIRGGAGNDTVELYGWNNIIQFGASDGKDLVRSFSTGDDSDYLQITSGSITSHRADDDGNYIINVGSSASITLEGVGDAPIPLLNGNAMSLLNADDTGTTLVALSDNTKLSGTSKADYIYIAGDHVTVAAGKGNDIIDLYSDYASIDCGDGNDSVNNDMNGDYSTIDGGAGNDTVYCYDFDYGSVNGGSGNDYIYGSYWYSTLSGGAGNDTIDIGSDSWRNIIQFGASDGNDLIRNYNNSTQIVITSGSITEASVSGSDYVIGVGSSARMTLEGAAGMSIAVQTADGEDLTFGDYDDSSDTMLANVSDDYWFMDEQLIEDESPLGEIVAPEPVIDLVDDPIAETIKPKLEFMCPARHRERK